MRRMAQSTWRVQARPRQHLAVFGGWSQRQQRCCAWSRLRKRTPPLPLSGLKLRRRPAAADPPGPFSTGAYTVYVFDIPLPELIVDLYRSHLQRVILVGYSPFLLSPTSMLARSTPRVPRIAAASLHRKESRESSNLSRLVR